jgi:Capsule polysaccharide biosynthesis protein
MRFLFTTIQSFESDFYGTVGAELVAGGHDVAHVTVSRRSERRLRARGFDARCVHDLIGSLTDRIDVHPEVSRIEAQYRLPSIRDVYRTDPASAGRGEAWCVPRTVDHFRAIEELFDDLSPDVLVPEVGNELIRTVAHHVALARGIPTLFLFYTIFPQPLRLYVDTVDAPIVPQEDLHPLSAEQREAVEAFIVDFTARRAPIRGHRAVGPSSARLWRALEYVSARLGVDRDNEYLRPARWAAEHVLGWGRFAGARALYQRPRASRPFVYFPLHVSEDYKIKRLIPEYSDQASIVERVAGFLPRGYDLVVKEHPLSIGRNPLALLRRLRRVPNLRLVHPHTNSHDLIERAVGVAVLSSTVGLEALLYGKPVLTIGRPFYAGYGITLDVDGLADLQTAVPKLMTFRPDRERIVRFLHAAMRACRSGSPVLVDRSRENAQALASSLERAAASAIERHPSTRRAIHLASAGGHP